MPLDRVTILCFAASYAVALGLECWRQWRPRAWQRLACLGFSGAGVLAQSIYLAVQRPALSTQFGSLLFLALVLAIFHLYGSIHHHRLAWGIFVLPVVLGLILLGTFFEKSDPGLTSGSRVLGVVHGTMLLLAGVGVCVGFVASVMYLVQAHRLRAKSALREGPGLLSLERLELMNRRAILTAFPLLTSGVIIGIALMIGDGENLQGWTDPKVLTAALLWLSFVVVLLLRYSRRVSGRRAAVMTLLAFALLVLTLVTPSHTFLGGAP